MREGIKSILMMSVGALIGWFMCETIMTNGRLCRPSFLLLAVILILVAPKGHGK